MKKLQVMFAVPAALLLAAGVGGCGSSGSSPAASAGASVHRVSAPSGATPPVVRESRTTRVVAKRVRRACRGERADRVIARYLPKARSRGADAALLRMAQDPPKRVLSGPGYAVLAGAVYAGSLPAARRAGVAPACARELQKTNKQSKSNEGASR